MLDSAAVVNLMDEVYEIVRDYPVAYNSRPRVRAAIRERLSARHEVRDLPDGSLLIDGAMFDVYRRGRDSLYEVRCRP